MTNLTLRVKRVLIILIKICFTLYTISTYYVQYNKGFTRNSVINTTKIENQYYLFAIIDETSIGCNYWGNSK